jgi:hypothetical protein
MAAVAWNLHPLRRETSTGLGLRRQAMSVVPAERYEE